MAWKAIHLSLIIAKHGKKKSAKNWKQLKCSAAGGRLSEAKDMNVRSQVTA